MRAHWVVSALLAFTSQLAAQPAAAIRDYESLSSKRLIVKERLGGLECHHPFLTTDAFTPDGKYAVYLGHNLFGEPMLEMTIWDVERGQVKHAIQFNQLESGTMTLTPDGKHALMNAYQFADKNNPQPHHHLYVVDVATGKIVRHFDTQEEAKNRPATTDPHIYLLAANNDGKTAVTVDGGGQMTRWDLAQKKMLGSWKLVDNPVLVGQRVFFPRSDKLLLTDKAKLNLIDTKTGKAAGSFPYQNIDPKDMIVHGVFTSDEKRLASVWADRKVRIFDMTNGKQLDDFSFLLETMQHVEAGYPVLSLAFVDEDTVLVVIPQFDLATRHLKPATLILRDVKAKKTLWTKSSLALGGMVPIAVVEQGKKAIVGGGPNRFLRINLADGTLETSWGGHKGAVLGLAPLPKGLYTFGLDGSAIRWDESNRDASYFAVGNPPGLNACAVSADGKILLTASGPTLSRRDPATGNEIKEIGKHDAGISALAIAPGGDWAVSAGSDRVMKTWDLKTGALISTYTGSPLPIGAVAVTPDAKTLISGGDDGTIRFWQVRGNAVDAVRKTFVLDAHPRAVTSLALSPDGKTLLSGSQDKTVKLWDVETRKLLKAMPGHGNWVTSVAFVGEERALSTSDDLTLRLWNLGTGVEEDKLDFGSVSDVPRCVVSLGGGAWAVGTTNWLVLKGELKK